jgi:hypothetical protein
MEKITRDFSIAAEKQPGFILQVTSTLGKQPLARGTLHAPAALYAKGLTLLQDQTPPLDDIGDFTLGHGKQFSGSEPKYCVRVTCCGPDFLVLQQCAVDVRGQGLRMAQGRHAANGKTGDRAHKLSVGFIQLLTDVRGHAFFVDPVGPAGDDQQCALGGVAAEDQRFSDLTDCAADRGRSFGGGARGFRKLDDLVGVAARKQNILNFLGTGLQGCGQGSLLSSRARLEVKPVAVGGGTFVGLVCRATSCRQSIT